MESKLWYTLSLHAAQQCSRVKGAIQGSGEKAARSVQCTAVCKTEWGGVEGGIRRWCSAVQSRVGRHYPTLLGRRSQFYPEQYLPPCPMPQLTSSILMRFKVQEQDTQPYRSMFLMYIYVYFEIFQNSWRSCQCHGESYSGAPMVGDKEGKPMILIESGVEYLNLRFEWNMKGLEKDLLVESFCTRGKQSPPLLCAATAGTVGTRNTEQIMCRNTEQINV